MKKILKEIYIGSVLFSMLFAENVFAKECDAKNKLCNPLKVETLDDLLTKILELIVRVGTIVIIFYIIFSGFKLVMAQGKPDAIKDAKKALMYSLIGGVILLGAKAISLVLQSTATSLGK